MNLLLSETHVDATRNCRIGETEPTEAWTSDAGKLFRTLQREYGRCVGSVYIDTAEGNTKRVGWMFQKTERYEDTGEPWTREVWVTLHDAKDTVVRTHHYHEL